MESKRDPFYEEPLHKAFYHPTKAKLLSEQQKRTALRGSSKHTHDDVPEKDTAKEKFLKGSHQYKRGGVSDGLYPDPESRYDESWPESERPSSISLPEAEPVSPISIGSREGKWTGWGTCAPDPLQGTVELDRWTKPERDTQKRMKKKGPEESGSVLAKYIQRFRTATPLSREEREKRKLTGNEKDFWWLSSSLPTPSDSSTPKETSSSKTKSRLSAKTEHNGESSPTIFRKPVKPHPSADISLETEKLQLKADRLLERAESSLNSSEPVVSTTGLGSDDRTSTIGSTVESMDEPCYRPHFTRLSEPIAERLGVRNDQDDDILTRWRQRRKLDQVRQKAGHTSAQLFSAHGTTPACDDEIETKLSEFRRKLAEGRSGHTSQNISFTPAPNKGLIETATQCLDERRGEDIHRTPISSKVMTADVATSPAAPRVASTSIQVACPHDSGTPVIGNGEVAPHLHRACDILPEKHSDKIDKCIGTKSKDGDQRTQKASGSLHGHHASVSEEELKGFSESVESSLTDGPSKLGIAPSTRNDLQGNSPREKPQGNLPHLPHHVAQEERESESSKDSGTSSEHCIDDSDNSFNSEEDEFPEPSHHKFQPKLSSRAPRAALVPPKCQKSPKSPVKYAIGKTVGEVFPSESFTMITSRDSWDSCVLFNAPKASGTVPQDHIGELSESLQDAPLPSEMPPEQCIVSSEECDPSEGRSSDKIEPTGSKNAQQEAVIDMQNTAASSEGEVIPDDSPKVVESSHADPAGVRDDKEMSYTAPTEREKPAADLITSARSPSHVDGMKSAESLPEEGKHENNEQIISVSDPTSAEVIHEEAASGSAEDMDCLLLADEEPATDDILIDLRKKRDEYISKLKDIESQLNIT